MCLTNNTQWLRDCGYLVMLSALAVMLLSACDNDGNGGKETSVAPPAITSKLTPVPKDPEQWVCHGPEPSPQQLEQLCAQDFGKPAAIGVPKSLLTLDEKNAFDFKLTDFVINETYKKLGWLHDKNWRMTGPYNGKPGEGISYGVHPAVRMYYSPEAMQWLCDGRPDEGMPDGAMIIKEMHDIDESLGLTVAEDGCMDIATPATKLDKAYSSWTIMIKAKKASADGWYWANPYKTFKTGGNPPIVDKSAFSQQQDVPVDPQKPDEQLIPTGNFASTPSIIYPYNGFGVACLNCHGSAEKDFTFSALDNLVSTGLRYKGYNFTQKTKVTRPVAEAMPRPLAKPSADFLKTYDQLHLVPFSKAWDLRMPAETFDHAVSVPGGKEFLTSDQCIACHDATISNDTLPNMMFEEDDGTLINLSMYGEWRVSPMGLAGRDPIFFSQLQSETNNLPDLAECIENTCLHCHGVLGKRQFSRDTADSPEAGKCNFIYPVQPPKAVATGKPFRLDQVTYWQNEARKKGGSHGEQGKYGALARDGISCMACHQMEADSVGDASPEVMANRKATTQVETLAQNEPFYTGNFVATRDNKIFGPLPSDQISPKPMQNVLNITPEYGEQLTKSEMCGNCHNILLPVINSQAEIVGAGYEQSTHLEWANSVFSQEDSEQFRSCQDCHMPKTYNGEKLSFKIANFESSDFAPTEHRLPDSDIEIKKVSPYPRHSLHGLNIFMNQMFQQFPEILGIRQVDYMNGNTRPPLLTGQDSMLTMAREQTAKVSVSDIRRNDNQLFVDVRVDNLGGHYMPSGVGFRRMFIEVVVKNAQGERLWASGSTNELGMLLNGVDGQPLPSEDRINNPKAFLPHYTEITEQYQAQVYEEVILDDHGDVTTSFLRRIKEVKDNRVRPLGYDPAFFKQSSSQYIRALGELHGTKDDPHYSDPTLTGSDITRYSITLPKIERDKPLTLEVKLFSQSIPPAYLQERFRDANRGPGHKNEIQRLFYITSHMNMDSPVDRENKPIIKNWKLQVAKTVVLPID